MMLKKLHKLIISAIFPPQRTVRVEAQDCCVKSALIQAVANTTAYTPAMAAAASLNAA